LLEKFSNSKKFNYVLILIICVFILAGGYFFYSSEVRGLKQNKNNEIKAIADMKISQISQWYKERNADVLVIKSSIFISKSVNDFLNNKDESSKDYLLQLLLPLKDNYSYNNIILSTPEGENCFSSVSINNNIDPEIIIKIKEAVNWNKIVTSDIYYSGLNKKVLLDIITPIRYDNQIRGVFIFRIDPEEFLYPSIQSWPIPSKTAETILVESQGDSVHFLNKPKFMQNVNLTYHHSLKDKESPYVQAALGFRGIYEGKDYRNSEVLAYIQALPGTPWIIITKIDKSEIYAELNSRAAVIGIFTLILLFLFGAGLAWHYNSRQKSLYMSLLEREKGKIIAEEALEKSNKEYKNLFENNPLPMWIYDVETFMFLEVNGSAITHYGYSKDEFLLMTIMDIRPSEDIESQLQNIKESTQKLRDSGIWRHKKKDGTIIFVEIISHAIEFKNIPSRLVLSNDVTDKYLAEEKMIAAKDKAEELSKLKSNLLSNMSHELRTPLIGIMGYTEMMINEFTIPEHIDMAKIVHNSGKRLLETLNLILDFTRLESAKMEIKLSTVSSDKLLNRLSVLFWKVIEADNIKFKMINNIPGLIFQSDERLLESILNNLLNNSIKFTQKGSITIRSDKILSDGKPYLEFSVEDTGIGIPKENQALIFDEFRQVSEGYSRKFEGSGLGLTIAKRFVELLDGKISVESEPGQGAKFTFIIPFISGENFIMDEEKTQNINELPNLSDYAILIVDDDQTSREIVPLMLRNLTTNIDAVDDGPATLEIVKKRKYDLILLDIGLKGSMDGIQALMLLRDIPGYKDTPVIAFTAFAMKSEKKLFLNHGFDDYLSKPFTKDVLLNILRKNLKIDNAAVTS